MTAPHAQRRPINTDYPVPTVFDNLILTIYLFVVFEGTLRKWIFPGAFDFLFFVRDPVVVAAYVYALAKYGFPLTSKSQMFA